MKAKDLKELSQEELNQKIRDTRSELVNLRVRKQAGQVENPSQLKALRRDIARMETVSTQKKAVSA